MIKALAGGYVNQGGEINQGESSKSSQRSTASGMSYGRNTGLKRGMWMRLAGGFWTTLRNLPLILLAMKTLSGWAGERP